eukprot:CAMPEP_0119514516 /NCGR_PEP_ID=MMETSP1344-20130328/32326_1 /TAXON_ID=236787 /ORGANISM="Florenciella parvula, Strain CCMP2471" /LENGTH=96 /DNA_ID=CAMNT_0007551845 /DNA_START=8 /DNA_END=298 /DNA_ORIENTATION=-
MILTSLSSPCEVSCGLPQRLDESRHNAGFSQSEGTSVGHHRQCERQRSGLDGCAVSVKVYFLAPSGGGQTDNARRKQACCRLVRGVFRHGDVEVQR